MAPGVGFDCNNNRIKNARGENVWAVLGSLHGTRICSSVWHLELNVFIFKIEVNQRYVI
jgi:hypothetical protein